MRKNRIIRLLAVVIAAIFATGLLTACKNEEQVLEEQLCAELDAIKDASDENLGELLGAEVIAEVESYGLDAHDIYNALLGRFDYTSKGVVIDGDTATATLSVTNIDVALATENYMNRIEAWSTSDEAIELIASSQGDDQMAFEAKVISIMIESLSDPELPLVTREVSIGMVKNADGDWEIADQEQAMNALFAGADMGSLF